MSIVERAPAPSILEGASEALPNRREIITKMQQVAPPGQPELDLPTYWHLNNLTRQLVEICGDEAAQEYDRYISIKDRA